MLTETLLLAALLPAALMIGSVSAADEVDYSREIKPLLETHCFACHAGEQTDGDFRLDDEISARRGGHTGQTIFGKSREESELYQRLISTDPSYQMPKRAPQLDPNEIELIGRWIEQGASYGLAGRTGWTDAVPAGGDETPGFWSASPPDWGEIWLALESSLKKPRYQYWPIVVLLLGVWLVLVIVKIRRAGFRRTGIRRTDSSRNQHDPEASEATKSDRWMGSERLSWLRITFILVLIGLVAIILDQRGQILELTQTVDSASQANPKRKPLPPVSLDRKQLTLPTDPMHPPRLGGIYYRGNDERDPMLFNQGFYRTATMEVWLVDQDDRVIAWNDSLRDRELSIRITIRRSPGTTPQLFTQRIMDLAYLRRFRETELMKHSDWIDIDESESVPLSVVVDDQVWEARLPLEPPTDWNEDRLAGVVYLFYGRELVDGEKGRIHFGIRYDLRKAAGIDDGRPEDVMSPESVLWMGSMYDLGGRVLIPQAGEILLNHWFDFRPIPEIEGEHTQDPTLLGIPEHD